MRHTHRAATVSTLQIIGLLLAVPTGFMFIRLALRGEL